MCIKRLRGYTLKCYQWLSMLETGMAFIFLFLLNTTFHVYYFYIITFIVFFLITKLYGIKCISIKHFYAYFLNQDTIIMRTQIQKSASLRASPTDICPCHRQNTFLFMFTALKNAQYPTARGGRFIIKPFISEHEYACKSFNRLPLSISLKAADVSNKQ